MRSSRLAASLLATSLLSAGCGAAQRQEEEIAEQSDYHYQLAIGFWQAREIPGAIRELQESLELNPENAQALFLMGFIFHGRRDYDRAEQFYRQALDLEPGWFEVMNNLGAVYLEQERWEEAEALFQPLTEAPTYNTPGHAHNNLGWALFNEGRVREAIEQFQLAVLFQPEHCLAHNNLGLAFETLGNETEAIDAYETAIDQCDQYPEPRYRLGVLLTNQGREPLRAHDLFQECYDLMPESSFGERCLEYLTITGSR